MRWYEPLLVPGILHTAEYAEAVMRRVIEFYEIPDDLDAGVSARMERRQILYRSNHKFHFIVTQQALLTTVGDSSVMIRQLDRLLAVMFDDIELYDMHYTLDGTWLGAEPVTDPSRIKQARSWRDTALARALPWQRYITGHAELAAWVSTELLVS